MTTTPVRIDDIARSDTIRVCKGSDGSFWVAEIDDFKMGELRRATDTEARLADVVNGLATANRKLVQRDS
jgi:hypothetical protein